MAAIAPPGETEQSRVGSRGLFARLSPTGRLLIACRLARSIGQGALVVDFALYLTALRWSALEIGAIYMGGLVLGAVSTLLSGPFSDRFGRKGFLIGYDIAQAVAAVAALLTSAPTVLVPAAIVGAFGRGANGSAGPFGPVEQAWLSDGLAEKDFGAVYSLNAAVGFGGMALGAALAALPPLSARWFPQTLAGEAQFRPLFLLASIGALVSLACLFRMTDARPQLPRAERKPRRADTIASTLCPGPMLLRLMAINTLNGLGIGIIGPFMALWFHIRYGQDAGAIGPVLALGFAMGGIASLLTGWLTRRLGTALAVVALRVVGLVLLIALPFAPNYPLAAACFVLRGAFNRGTAGARQAVGLRLVGPGRRGLAASLNAISMQIPRAIGPVIGGVLLDSGLFALPMLLAAAFQAVYLALYAITFRHID